MKQDYYVNVLNKNKPKLRELGVSKIGIVFEEDNTVNIVIEFEDDNSSFEKIGGVMMTLGEVLSDTDDNINILTPEMLPDKSKIKYI